MGNFKRYKIYIRVLKVFHAYGNFMINMKGNDLHLFDDTEPYEMVNKHAFWAATPQGYDYWRCIDLFFRDGMLLKDIRQEHLLPRLLSEELKATSISKIKKMCQN